MAYKEWFRSLQPIQIYLVLIFTTAFFIVELIYSYFTHALTLLVNAYYMLCNIVALIGCIASIKHSNRENSLATNSANCVSSDENFGSKQSSIEIKQSRSDRRMKNTFGWARINILTMLVCCVLLGSFCFSLQVEALQTLVHISHSDAMHQPLAVLRIGVAGIFVNIFCYILIGGYTFHHGSSLQLNRNGRIIVKRNIATGELKNEEKSTEEIQNRSYNCQLKFPGKPGIKGMFRDILGCVFVVIVSILVYYTDTDQSDDSDYYSNNSDSSNYSDYSINSNNTDIISDNFHVAKFIDPVIAIMSSTSLFLLSYPYMKESGLILLQTIPNHININSLKKELLAAFPDIVNVHDLHVWQFTGDKIISTAHIIFLNPTVYTNIRHQVTNFFLEMGITQVTIQPEFQKIIESTERIDCLIKCRGKNCSQSVCCLRDKNFDIDKNVDEIKTCDQSTNLPSIVNKKFEKKVIVPIIDSHRVDLKRFTLHTDWENECISDNFHPPKQSNELEDSQSIVNNDCNASVVGLNVKTSSVNAETVATIQNEDCENSNTKISETNFGQETV